MKKPPEQKSKGDIVHTVVKAAASAIPIAGGPAVVIFEEVFRKPIEARRQKWLEMLAEAVVKRDALKILSFKVNKK